MGDADELILKMQHLDAGAREQVRARALQKLADTRKTRAQQMAFDAQQEVDAAETAQAAAEAKLAQAREPGRAPLEAADLLLAGKSEQQEAKTRLVKARARLNFALDQMDEAERQAWEAMQADARAEAHAQLAEDPLFQNPAK